MSTRSLATLKAICATYHEVSVADLTANGVDLFLAAANNVRKNAELLHNFEYTRVQATLSIDGTTGGALSGATIVGDVATTSQVTITGTLSPDATGVYAQRGSLNGKAFYTKDDLSYLLFFDGNLTYTITDPDGTNQWTQTVSSTSPVGTFTASAPATGAATVADTSTGSAWSGIKEVLAVQRTNSDGTLSPLNFTQAETPIERDRWKIELSDNYDLSYRYPSDARFLARGTEGTIIQRRGTLFIYPVPATSVQLLETTLECYAWLADYTATTLLSSESPDFLITHGFNYFQWAIICELNTLFKSFVQRQEGNVPEPQAKADQAWHDLLLWDTYQVAANATRPR